MTMLRALIDPAAAEGHAWELFLAGAAYSFLGVVIGFFLFGMYAGIALISIPLVAATPLVYNIIRYEAKKDSAIKKEYRLLQQHTRAAEVFGFLFLGFTAGYLAGFLMLPAADAESIFIAQLDTITEINAPESSGMSTVATEKELMEGTGAFFREGRVAQLFLNNARVLFLCILFSLLLGAGGLFILIWNASVIAVAMGGIAHHLGTLGAVAKYALHGVPEIGAYLIGALAGGILYHAALQGKLTKHSAGDIALLTVIACGFLVVAAILEVYATPLVLSLFT